MRGRQLCVRMCGSLVAALTLLAVPCAAAADSSPTTTSPGTSAINCPTPLPTLGCPVPGSGGSGGSGGSSPSGSSAPTTPSPKTSTVPADQVLSNEMSFTTFAYVKRVTSIYRQPSTRSRRVSRLSWYTEDGFNSVYVLLRAHWTSKRTEWIEIRVPGRPNGRTGWVQRNALGAFHVTHDAVVVNREQM